MTDSANSIIFDARGDGLKMQEEADALSHLEKTETKKSNVAKESLSAASIDYPDGGLRAWLIVVGVRILFSMPIEVPNLTPRLGVLFDVFDLWIRKFLGGKPFIILLLRCQLY
jgi:hypothetical protein